MTDLDPAADDRRDDGDSSVGLPDHEGHEAEDHSAQQEASTARRGAFVLALSLALVFAVAAAVLGLLLVRSDDDPMADLRATAGRFGETLVTYDYRQPKDHRDAVLAMSTGSFQQQYQEAFDRGLGSLITEAKATSKGHVKDVYLSAQDSDQVAAVVAVDIDHDGIGGPRTLHDIYFRLTMIRLGGEWLVDDVVDLNFNSAGAPTSPPVTGGTTTTAPEAPTSSVP